MTTADALHPNPPDSLAPQRTLPSHFRRLLAFGLDLFVAAIAAILVAALFQLVWPPDTQRALVCSVVTGGLMSLLYLGLAVRYVGNSAGKWLFSLKLVSRTEAPLSVQRLCKRLLAAALWPVNALLVLTDPQRAHLGDRWAQSGVVVGPRPRNIWLALGAALVLVVGATMLASEMSRVAMSRTRVWQVAKAHLASEPGITVPALPTAFSVLQDVAMFHADVGTGLRRVVLMRDADGWYVTETQTVENVSEWGKITVAPRSGG